MLSIVNTGNARNFSFRERFREGLNQLKIPVAKGNTAPDFTLTNWEGKAFTLSVDAKRTPVLLFFYPRNFTAICTEQACILRDSYELFLDLGIKLVGISSDDPDSHKLFKSYYQLPFELLSDPNRAVSQLYDAVYPVVNISKRVTYLLDHDHKIIASHSSLLSADGHLNSMVRFIKENHLDPRWSEMVYTPEMGR